MRKKSYMIIHINIIKAKQQKKSCHYCSTISKGHTPSCPYLALAAAAPYWPGPVSTVKVDRSFQVGDSWK